VSAKYSPLSAASFRETELGTLLERGIIWTTPMLDNLELSRRTHEVWLVTPDLEPDCSDERVGSMVKQNLRRGVRYIYFYPQDLDGLKVQTQRLYANLGVTRAPKRLEARVALVPISPAEYPTLFHRGNTILFFKGESASFPPNVFEEVVFTRVSRRGLFWQECDRSAAGDVHRILANELHKWMSKPSL